MNEINFSYPLGIYLDVKHTMYSSMPLHNLPTSTTMLLMLHVVWLSFSYKNKDPFDVISIFSVPLYFCIASHEICAVQHRISIVILVLCSAVQNQYRVTCTSPFTLYMNCFIVSFMLVKWRCNLLGPYRWTYT